MIISPQATEQETKAAPLICFPVHQNFDDETKRKGMDIIGTEWFLRVHGVVSPQFSPLLVESVTHHNYLGNSRGSEDTLEDGSVGKDTR